MEPTDAKRRLSAHPTPVPSPRAERGGPRLEYVGQGRLPLSA